MLPSPRVLLLSVLLLWGLAAASQPEALFEKATRAYNEGNYDQAIEYYEQILGEGRHSAAVYFNMGNAYYKKNEIAPSIYYYEKALLLDPDDEEIRNNLVFARNMTLDAITPLPQSDLERFYDRLLTSLSLHGWAYLGVLFGLLFVLGYILFLTGRTPNKKRIALIGSLAALFIAMAATALSYLRYQAYLKDQPAVIFAREIQVRSEPNQGSSPVFLLHEGTKVQVRDSLDQWRRIALADGQVGWVPATSLRLLKDF